MNDDRRRRRLDDDDSLLASFAGVPLTRMARIGLCLVWAGFWAARLLLTDALIYVNPLAPKAALSELLGAGPFDQGFSICMVWLTVEVAAIVADFTSGGIKMLIAKTPRGLKASIVAGAIEGLSAEDIEAIVAEKRKAQREKDAKAKGERD